VAHRVVTVAATSWRRYLPRMSNFRFTPVIVILLIVAAVLVVVGIVYLAQPASSLPSFLPGHVAHATSHRSKRGAAALLLGVIVFVGAGFLAVRTRRAS
jgi:hypothetical protein